MSQLLEAKKSIQEATDHLEKNYRPIFRIIDEKMKGRLDSPLHMAAYFLNPYYFYKIPHYPLDNDVNFVLTTQAPRIRELYDDNFESEEEDMMDMEFEPDVYQEDPVFRDSQIAYFGGFVKFPNAKF
ncbi:hypothetical protein HID58_084900 [Brassica napus]|uniref:Uncharacterized protein n=1 Tax=Brassica napus TaxID=3708 RepID=A0ABQ7XL25_BRANA|nr:hypothetical protein HID58_084900 [Brassica napus]